MQYLSISEILSHKEELTAPKHIDIHIPRTRSRMEGYLEAVQIPYRKVLEIKDEFSRGGRPDNYGFTIALLYACIPALHSTELQEGFGCADPRDIVMKVFGESFEAASRASMDILESYDAAEEAEALKN